ncbi:hypothetical protein HS088_TW08G00700 [Tripterygium wilfordii]|uniref:Uncharacterized protein n=1 Tax=Tripterygium wilfordii TaxID=458696 RepID=A0A7J7DCN6_TRIWF|nr:uncharacterized protein LOC120004288 [Tripterygium wilfordii]KAF5744107.1 hypothetical protein HS088_TW08G00700 [Tripterygium wilfordii]
MNLSPDNRVIPDPNFPPQEPRIPEGLCITQSLPENQYPHSSKTLILEEEDPDTQNSPPPPQDPPVEVEEQMQDDLEEVTNFSPLATYSRRGGTGGGPKRKKLNQKRRAAHEKKSQKKLEILLENLNPIPFVPIKILDFSSHEELLKRLGLWDFVHLEFDRNIRSDLIAQLIANYSPLSRCSYVNGVRIKVNRADLARALRLPVRKEKAGTAPENAPVVDETEDAITFIEELVSNWMLLHEDMWMMPTEMMNWTKLIKEGHFEKVDWALLMWFMLEKELLAAPQLGDCYYASHMLCLITCQREALLREEEPKIEIDTKEDEGCSGDLKVADDTRGPEKIEEKDIELSLGQDNTSKEEASKEHVGIDDLMDEKEHDGNEEPMDIEETKGEECGQWVGDGKSNVGTYGLFLRRCNIGDVGNIGGMFEEKKGGGEGEEDGHGEEEIEGQEGNEEVQDMGFHFSPEEDALETVTSANLIATMEAMQSEPFSSGLQLLDDNGPSGEFLVSKVSTHLVPGSSMLFGNGSNKGVIEQENDMSHQSLNDSNKRLRTEGPWDTDSDDLGTCMDQAQEWIGKARMMHLAKKRDYDVMSVNQQCLLSEMQQRADLIEYLRKAHHEEQQKRQVDVYRLEHELYMMRNLLEGYRKALKETHKAFSEYRAQCPIPEEPLYKDAGSGGLVLSKWELEKLRMKQEEEERMNRLLIEKKIKDFEADWSAKFDLHEKGIGFLGNKLWEVEKELVHVKDAITKRKLSERVESVANEGGIVSEMVESVANEGESVSEMVESDANEGGSDQ